MKPRTLLLGVLFLSLCMTISAQQRVPVFKMPRETMGTPASTTQIAAHNFDGKAHGYTYDGGGAAAAGDVRTSSPSAPENYRDANNDPASGGGNVFLGTAGGNPERGFAMHGIDCSDFSDMLLGFAFRKPNSSANPAFVVEYSRDAGTTWVNIPYKSGSGYPLENDSSGWYYVKDIIIPSGADGAASLSLRWVREAGGIDLRLDDVVLLGMGALPPLPPPTIKIQSPAQKIVQLPKEVTARDIDGVATDAQGHIVWKNLASGLSGTAAAGNTWFMQNVPLRSGTNVVLVWATNNAVGRYVGASDHSANGYAGVWQGGQNFGAGFGPWEISRGDENARTLITNSAMGGMDIDTNGSSWAISAPGGYVDATRAFIEGPLAVGNAVQFDLGMMWLNGNRGFNLLDADGNELYNFNGSGDNYTVNGNQVWDNGTGEGYNFHVTVDQMGEDATRVSIVRINAYVMPVTNVTEIAGKPAPAAVKFYGGEMEDVTSADGPKRRLYINKMRVLTRKAMDQVTFVKPPADPPVLTITDPAQKVIEVEGIVREYTVEGTSLRVNGELTWQVMGTELGGTIPAGATWSIADIDLTQIDGGTNVVVVTGTNASPEYVVMARDKASNYASWEAGMNEGAGFGPWEVDGNPAAYMLLDSSAEGGEDMDIDTDGKSWCIYGKWDNWMNVERDFILGALEPLTGFGCDFAFNYFDGGRGLTLMDENGEELFFFFAFRGDGDDFNFNGTTLYWGNTGRGYNYNIRADVLASGLTRVTVSRSDGASHSETYDWANLPARVKFFSGNNQWDEGEGNPDNNKALRLYINNMSLHGYKVMDQATIIRLDPSAPSVSITSPVNGQRFPADTASVPVTGTANTNAVGDLTWTVQPGGQSGSVPAGTTWSIASVPLATGDNTIRVQVQNSKGEPASASVTVNRMPPPSVVTVTSPATPVTNFNQVTHWAVSGTASNAARVDYVNYLTDEQGSVPVFGGTWSITNLLTAPGINYVEVSTTNSTGYAVEASDAASSYGGVWSNASNRGFGFEPWTLLQGDNLSYTIGRDSYGEWAWGLEAYAARVAEAGRVLEKPLASGDEVSFTLSASPASDSAGVVLLNAEDEPLLAFLQRDGYYWVRHGGGKDEWTGISNEDGVKLTLTLRPNSAFVLGVEAQGGGTILFKGSLLSPALGDQTITSLKLWSYRDELTPGDVFYVSQIAVRRWISRDFAQITRESELMPSIRILVPSTGTILYVENDVTNYPVSGDCNAASLGRDFTFQNEPAGSVGSFPAALAWTNEFELFEGDNVITVTARNEDGNERSATVTIFRERSGIYTNYPGLDVVYPTKGLQVPYLTDKVTIEGVTDARAKGDVVCWQIETVDASLVPIDENLEWFWEDRPLEVGLNRFVFWVTNSGLQVWASDRAQDYTTVNWTNESNRGSGMKGWTLQNEGTASNRVVNVPPAWHAWTLYSGADGVGKALRQFNEYFREGDQLDISLRHTVMASGAKSGVGLINQAGQKLVEFYFDGELESYVVADEAGVHELDLEITTSTLHLTWGVLNDGEGLPREYILFVGEEESIFREVVISGRMRNPLWGRMRVSGLKFWNSFGGSGSSLGVSHVSVTGGRSFAYTYVIRDQRPPRPVWINEVNYAANDVREGVENAGLAGHSLEGYYLAYYAPDGRMNAGRTSLAGAIPDEDGSGWGAFWVPVQLENAYSNAVAFIYEPESDQVVNFLSWGPSVSVIQAKDGPASGLWSEWIGVHGPYVDRSYSLQLVGIATNYEGFRWTRESVPPSPNRINAGQFISGMAYAGLPDVWWNKYFADKPGQSPGMDYDDDGFTNEAEFYAGTDPTNKDSALTFLGVELEGDSPTFSFPVVPDRDYRVLRSTNLVSGVWTQVWPTSGGWGRPREDQTTITVSDSNPVQNAIFRVEVRVPGWE